MGHAASHRVPVWASSTALRLLGGPSASKAVARWYGTLSVPPHSLRVIPVVNPARVWVIPPLCVCVAARAVLTCSHRTVETAASLQTGTTHTSVAIVQSSKQKQRHHRCFNTGTRTTYSRWRSNYTPSYGSIHLQQAHAYTIHSATGIYGPRFRIGSPLITFEKCSSRRLRAASRPRSECRS